MTTFLTFAFILYLLIGICCTLTSLLYKSAQDNAVYTTSLIILWLPILFFVMRQDKKLHPKTITGHK